MAARDSAWKEIRNRILEMNSGRAARMVHKCAGERSHERAILAGVTGSQGETTAPKSWATAFAIFSEHRVTH